MQTEKLLEALNDIEKKGLELENKSFKCGIHTDDKTQKTMRDADRDFSNAIQDLRKIIISEGV
jgi:hypothetical protein